MEKRTQVTPLSIPPSEHWDGNDGPWSTFRMQVGTPSQNVRLLPATGQSSMWVVLPEGCAGKNIDNCGYNRGFEFSINASSTWADIGVYQLALEQELFLGYSGNGHYGFDTVTMGWQGDSLPTLYREVVTGIATTEFFLGSIGIEPRSVNFTTFNDPQPSLLQSLRNESKIPSSSWGYTAGAYNNIPKAFGSLTLGGYDASRFIANDLTFNFSGDTGRDFLVGIQHITSTSAANGPTTALSGNNSVIFAYIDSLVPHIWLPTDVCQAFETSFGL
ncbi:hypothetical protein LTR39_002820, partial [Cryomyces antarcticus]